ncbi:unnamed protein product [Schistosoma spindalis]|nr:unnamed protein product [Schistosoma spindale]
MLPYFDYQFRVIIIGDSMVGKSSLMKSFVEGNFTPVSDPTIGVDFFSRTVRIQEEVFVKLQLWDTAGQEKFRTITSSYYRNCVGVVVVFDLTDRETFDHVADWYEEARGSIKCSAPVFIIVGHKADRRDERQLCAGGIWDGVKQGHNAALAASLASRSIQFDRNEPKPYGDCC